MRRKNKSTYKIMILNEKKTLEFVKKTQKTEEITKIWWNLQKRKSKPIFASFWFVVRVMKKKLSKNCFHHREVSLKAIREETWNSKSEFHEKHVAYLLLMQFSWKPNQQRRNLKFEVCNCSIMNSYIIHQHRSKIWMCIHFNMHSFQTIIHFWKNKKIVHN